MLSSRRVVGEYQQTQPCLLARGDRLWELIICNTYKYFIKYRKIKSYFNCLLRFAIYAIFQIFLYCHGLRGNPTLEGEAFDARVCMPKTKRFSEAVRWIDFSHVGQQRSRDRAIRVRTVYRLTTIIKFPKTPESVRATLSLIGGSIKPVIYVRT